jgi:hypothetical protein
MDSSKVSQQTAEPPLFLLIVLPIVLSLVVSFVFNNEWRYSEKLGSSFGCMFQASENHQMELVQQHKDSQT